MKHLLYIPFLLLVFWAVSCVNGEKHAIEAIDNQEETHEIIQSVEPKQAIHAVDTTVIDHICVFGDHVFFSQPVPDEVKARMKGKSMKDQTHIGYDDLRYLTLPYYDFDGEVQSGEMVCHKAIAEDLVHIFRDLFAARYPIANIRLVDDFDADDEASMQANNTTCFNYRYISGTRMLSKHAFGLAVDINPLQNPCVRGNHVQPKTALDFVDRDKDFPHKIDEDDLCKRLFTARGFRWGGHWQGKKDWQHFEKRVRQ